MISLDVVTKTYPLGEGAEVTAIRDINLEVARGEFLVIAGRSGAGKTTLLQVIAGLTRPTSGRVLWHGTDLWALPDAQRTTLRRQRIGFVFQFPSLLPSLTAIENVILPTAFGPDWRDPGDRERAGELLQQVGMLDRCNAFPRQLSAGQQQRVVIARALINHPQVLLADEPTSDLDERTESEIMDMFCGIHATGKLTLLMVTHALQLVPRASRVIEMAGGALHTEKASR
jgi:ABC-type lipoprotein export system ATPase subunit